MILIEYHLRSGAGLVFSESLFTLGVNRARIPDVAWVSEDRASQIPSENRVIAIAPDVAVEIISVSEQTEEMDRKLRDYLEAGVEVWQILPATSSLIIWRGRQGVRVEGEQSVTSVAMPGFAVQASEFFLREKKVAAEQRSSHRKKPTDSEKRESVVVQVALDCDRVRVGVDLRRGLGYDLSRREALTD